MRTLLLPLLLLGGCSLFIGAEGEGEGDVGEGEGEGDVGEGEGDVGEGEGDAGEGEGDVCVVDGTTAAGEGCDDGNFVVDDGCDNDCVASGVVALSAGGGVTCVVTRNGNVRCFGRNDAGQLGAGHTAPIGDTERASSAPLLGFAGPVREVAVGGQHVCAVTGGDAVYCWGANSVGQLGSGIPGGAFGDTEVVGGAGHAPVDVSGAVASVVSGATHSCALRRDGSVVCWGGGSGGVVGRGDNENVGDNEVPGAASVPLPGVARALVAGDDHTCAVTGDERLYCWGKNGSGQLGTGDLTDVGNTPGFVPRPVELPVGRIDAVAAGAFHTCAAVGGRVYCWGGGGRGQLGDGSSGRQRPNGGWALGAVTALAAGKQHTCALFAGGLACWGANADGQLGLGNTTDVVGRDGGPTLTAVALGTAPIAFDVGDVHGCAVDAVGRVVCFGDGDNGALGYGDPFDVGDGEAPVTAGFVPVFAPVASD